MNGIVKMNLTSKLIGLFEGVVDAFVDSTYGVLIDDEEKNLPKRSLSMEMIQEIKDST